MRKLLGVSVAALMTGQPLPAAAAEADQSPALSSPSDPFGEIVVSAQKRDEKLQDVPVSITALSGDAVQRLGMKTSAEIAAQVPNLTIKQSFANSVPQIFLRGVGINDPNANANGAVGVYVDEVNLVSPSALTFSLFDTERVEVLRGPQGTLYGRNTTGGAVNFISRKPGDELEGYVNFNYGRFNAKRTEAAVGGPLGAGIGARISGVWEDSDGYHLNRVTGNRMADVGRWALRGLVRIEPASNVEVLLNVHGGHVRNSSTPFEIGELIDPATGGFCDYRARRDCVDALGYADSDNTPFAHDLDFEGFTRIENFGASARLNADFGGFVFTSITAYENTHRFHTEDSDASPTNTLLTSFDDRNKQFSQELRLASDGSGRLDWIAGLFYSRETTTLRNTYDFFRAFRPQVEATGFPGGFDPDAINPTGFPTFLLDQRLRQLAHSYAGFVNTEYHLSGPLSIVAGARYTWEDRSIVETLGFDEPVPTTPIFDNFGNTAKFRAFSGKLGLNYKPNDDLLLYGAVSRGFKSGGFNGALVFSTDALQPFRPEHLTAYEIGFKSEFFDRKATFNLAGFYYDYKDLQLYTFGSVNGLQIQLLTNAGSAEIYGAEAELSLRPLSGLVLNFGTGLLHTQISDYQTISGDDFTGNRLVLAPTMTANALARYEVPLGMGGTKIAFQTDVHYQSRVYFDTSNRDILSQPGYALWNARVSLADQNDKWELGAQVRNISKKRYITEAFDFSSAGYNLQIFGPPQVWELSATYRF